MKDTMTDLEWAVHYATSLFEIYAKSDDEYGGVQLFDRFFIFYREDYDYTGYPEAYGLEYLLDFLQEEMPIELAHEARIILTEAENEALKRSIEKSRGVK